VKAPPCSVNRSTRKPSLDPETERRPVRRLDPTGERTSKELLGLAQFVWRWRLIIAALAIPEQVLQGHWTGGGK